ncbi:MAG: NAD-glutamate dehydrogenase [Polaromonas sp.]|nr:NAD-glutamate dehydrogenase [Polaromonas sp.]
MTLKQRNKLLAEMTDDVAQLVLTDNYYQTQSLSVSGVRGEKLLDSQAELIRALEKAGRLSRAVEFLPSDDEISERRAAKQGLTGPERGVLLAYSKMTLFDELLNGKLIDDGYVAQALVGYFPQMLQKKYADLMPRHPLKREIIATVVANTMINRTGSIFVHRMVQETGAAPEEVTRAYVLVRDIFKLDELWLSIDALDNNVPALLQYEMLVEVGRLVVRGALWFLRRRREKMPIAQVLDIFRPALEKLQGQVPKILSEGDRAAWEATVNRFTSEGVPREVAERTASLGALYAVLDVTEVALDQKKSVESMAALYFALVGELELRWFSDRITQLPTDTNWQALARNALRDDLASQQRALTATVAKLSESADPAAMLASWRERYAPAILRLKSMIEEMKRQGALDLAVLSVLLRELRSLA